MLRRHIHDRRRRPWQVFVLLACLSLSAYFAYHAIHGRHGLKANSQLTNRSTLLEFEVRGLEAVRTKLERDIALLGQEPPHPDLVEDVARGVLGFAKPGDRVLTLR